MKNNCKYISLFFLILLCAGWGSEDSTSDTTKKHKVNFAGTITTCCSEKAYNVDNIAINGKFKQIPFYEFQQPVEEGATRYTLKNDPKECVLIKIDLSEISAIINPTPDIVWTYQKDARKDKAMHYVHVDIISNSGTKNSYLFPFYEGRKEITCDEIDAAGPRELEMSIKSIKEIKITGYTHRDEKKKEQKEKNDA